MKTFKKHLKKELQKKEFKKSFEEEKKLLNISLKILEARNELVDVFETDWYKSIKSKTKPGDNMKIYREIHKLTQEKLGGLLGGIPRQHVSNMERGTRSISLKTAKQLSKIFKVSPEKFI